jgi:hypothetical protein
LPRCSPHSILNDHITTKETRRASFSPLLYVIGAPPPAPSAFKSEISKWLGLEGLQPAPSQGGRKMILKRMERIREGETTTDPRIAQLLE